MRNPFWYLDALFVLGDGLRLQTLAWPSQTNKTSLREDVLPGGQHDSETQSWADFAGSQAFSRRSALRSVGLAATPKSALASLPTPPSLQRSPPPSSLQSIRFAPVDGGRLAKGYSFKTPSEFAGTREGAYDSGTFRIRFTLPSSNESEALDLDLMQSRAFANSSFGAVRLFLPLGLTIEEKGNRFVVSNVREDGNAAKAKIQKGDILRAMSAADPDEPTAWDIPWWRFIYGLGLPGPPVDSDRGINFLDGLSTQDLKRILRENLRVQGYQCEVVLVIERPENPRGSLITAYDAKYGADLVVQPGELGMDYDADTGKLFKVEAEGQLGRRGVKAGWRMLQLNRERFSRDLIRNLTNGAQSYNITVTSVPEPERPNGLTALSEWVFGRPVDLMYLNDSAQDRMLWAIRTLSRGSSRPPTLSEVARKMDMIDGEDKGDRYYFHLNALNEIRRENDLLYNSEVAPSEHNRSILESIDEVNLYSIDERALNGSWRQKGPLGENFIVLSGAPKSSTLRSMNNAWRRKKCLMKLDKTIARTGKGSKSRPNATAFFRKVQSSTFAKSSHPEYDQILTSLGRQVIKRRSLGEPDLTAEQLWSRIMDRTDELYQVHEEMSEPFKRSMKYLVTRAGLSNDDAKLEFAPLKDPVRIYEKAMDDYSTPPFDTGDGVLAEAWIDDVLRCTLVAPDIGDIARIQDSFKALHTDPIGGPGFSQLRLVRTKNRFHEPGVTKFRHFLHKFELSNGSLSVLCEMQVQDRKLRALDVQKNSHYHYSYFRAALEERSIQMQLQSGRPNSADVVMGQKIDGEIFSRLLAYEKMLEELPKYGADAWVEGDRISSKPWPDVVEDVLQRIVW